jgi:ribosomal protein S18 acetylase RimI-like enzyme
MTSLEIREATPADERFLGAMFVEAVLWRPEWPRVGIDALLEQRELARYFAGWGRAGDVAVVAATAEDPRVLVGAGWFRQFTEGEPGYGFVSSRIPELGIAVSPDWRGRGVGSAILRRLQETATARGLEGLSLSVHPENPAQSLYRRAGFVPMVRTGTAMTMLWRRGGASRVTR